MSISKLNNFQQRFLMSFLGIALLAAVLISSHIAPLQYIFVAALATLQALALSEYYTLSKLKGFHPLKLIAVIISIVYILMHYAYRSEITVVPFLFSLLALSFIWLFTHLDQAIPNLAITLFGFVYITIPLGFLIDINFMPSLVWIIYLLVTTKITDTAAYCAGKLLGNHPLAPTLSPKKTLEGACAGLVGAIVASLAFIAAWRALGYPEGYTFSWFEAALLGMAVGIISQIGDLAESLIKRDAQVKDSSTLPGFGGMLDVVDSLIFTTPLLYFWLKAKNLL